MIVYLASYPRSGNFWLQSIVANNFGFLTCNIHPTAAIDMAEYRDRVDQYYEIRVLPAISRSFLDEVNICEGCLFEYESGSKIHRGLRSGCGHVLQDVEIRKQLAAADECYFVKTHLRPYPEYFQGEMVVQIVRNPGAVLWSYYNFVRELENERSNYLLDFIKGDVGYGSWSEYHQVWQNARKTMGEKFLSTNYEAIHADEEVFLTRLSEFSNLPVLSRKSKSFEYYHQLRPNLARTGRALGWETHYSIDELALLWSEHGEMMRVFGYGEANYDNAKKDE